MSNNEQKTENEKPLWQQISGIDPNKEKEMDAEARDAALRKLILDVERRAGEEIERAAAGKIPAGERTIFWDPMTRICLQLGISRTKLSAYSRELTGMRAFEISDRILAKRVLRVRLQSYVEKLVTPELEEFGKNSPRGVHPAMRKQFEQRVLRWMKSLRSKERRAGFAAALGFANPSRLSRACLLAHGMSIDEMEARLVCTLVQKFFSESGSAQKQFDLMRAEVRAKHEMLKKEGNALSEGGMAILEQMIDEAEGLAKRKVAV